MPLTPEDVRNKLFTTVRLREGYEQAEVDEFLDEVEAELTRLLRDNDDLRTRLAAALRGDASAAADPSEEPPAVMTAEAVAPPTEPVAETRAPAAAPQIVVHNADEVGEKAARLLSMAQRTADETVAEAQSDAERMVAEARENAERMTAEAAAKADELDRETRARGTALDTELAEQRERVLGKLEEERARLAHEVEDLKSFEREYRGRLRSFLEGQLQQLQTRGSDDTPLAPAGGPQTDASFRNPGHALATGTRGAPAASEDDDDDDVNEGTSTPPQSALGRILEEEERDDDEPAS